MEQADFFRRNLGSKEIAERVAEKAENSVPAYGKFLEKYKFGRGSPFEARPIMDKASYISAHPFSELLPKNHEDIFTIFKSSGSSGHSFFWPQLKQSHRHSANLLRTFLETAFFVDQGKTLAIVGLALGSWIGGDYFSWILKSMAVETPYSFAVFSPGNHHEEIIEIIIKAEIFVDQIILFVCPSAISRLHLRADQRGFPLPKAKMKYVVIGEPFPESLRFSILENSRCSENSSVMLSVFGSADTGVLGFESSATVAIRQLLSRNSKLLSDLQLPVPVPHFFHSCAPNAYLESENGELCVTLWQGIPIVRYNLHDSCRLYNWKEFRNSILAFDGFNPEDEPFKACLWASKESLPDIIAIQGRSDSCLILCGTNITEGMLDEAVKCSELESVLTGVYKAQICYENERQFLELHLEFSPHNKIDSALLDRVYSLLIQALGRVQPEFLDDWRNVYKFWDDDPSKQIIRIKPFSWPALSQTLGAKIKQRGISR
ncbi:hypothetical protein HYY75_01330 [bacterium]|nr:hypothetical protein [bacterium]